MEGTHQVSGYAAMDTSTAQSDTLRAECCINDLHAASALRSCAWNSGESSDMPCRDYCFGLSIWSEMASVVTGLIVMITMRYLQVPLVESLPGG